MSIADQVATVEHDLAAALAQIDALNAAKAALESANASLQRDNVGLQLEVNDMKHYVDDTRALAETLANSALDMLRASRRQVGGQAEITPYAKPKEGPMPQITGKIIGRALGVPDAQNFKVDATGKVHLLDTPAQRAVAEIMTSDSGDEQPAPDWKQDQAETSRLLPKPAPLGFTHCKDCPDPRACDGTCRETARAGPMLVEHNKDDLPIFLRSAPAERGAVFG